MQLSMIQYIAVAIIPVLFAITVHEVAHGWVASRLGDPTAKMLGRLTLNPIKHMDLVGTVIVPVAMLVLGGFIFGWAKPVPVDARNFKYPQRDMVWVAIAGPLSNLLMAFLWAIVLKVSVTTLSVEHWLSVPLLHMAKIGMQINLVLMVLNLIPVPPLDGSKVLMGFLPGPAAYKFSRLEPYGLFIIIALIYLGVLSALLQPVMAIFYNFVSVILGL